MRWNAAEAMNYETTQNLVNTFVNSTARHFLELEKRYKLVRSLEAAVFESSGIQKVLPEEISNRLFFLNLILKGPKISFVIKFGDRENYMNCIITCKQFDESYALWEWLAVLSNHCIQLKDSGGFVVTSARVEAVLSEFEQALDKLMPDIANADISVENQLKLNRNERALIEQQRIANEEHSHLAFMASEAFHRQDYQVVVELLSAIQGQLTSSEQLKLNYAKKLMPS